MQYLEFRKDGTMYEIANIFKDNQSYYSGKIIIDSLMSNAPKLKSEEPGDIAVLFELIISEVDVTNEAVFTKLTVTFDV